jgi:alpha,alpha-trehalase
LLLPLAHSSQYLPPDQLFGDLFREVQLTSVFTDSKTFVDCVPELEASKLMALYESEKVKPDFNLVAFVNKYFLLPSTAHRDYVSDRSRSTVDHINSLWDNLTRLADTDVPGSSRVSLPNPYVVPGGRFREIFYWDTYFTMLGLGDAGRWDLIRAMLDNFAYLIDTFGFIPNGNRTYFLTRSQPPFFALMVRLLAEVDGPDVLLRYLPHLQKEHDFWMTGQAELTLENPFCQRVVRMPDGQVLNRFWDPTEQPRAEAFKAEYELSRKAIEAGVDPQKLHVHLRAACESGWDFSSRWFSTGMAMVETRTADLVPVDLNCTLYSLEKTLQEGYQQAGNLARAANFERLAQQRKQAIDTYFWQEETGFYYDYDLLAGQQTPALTLASAFPLFFNLASPQQGARVHQQLKEKFLQAGGWVTTLENSGQQWDWPNGWAPLQWIVYQGLANYGFQTTADEARDRWLALNDKVFKSTGKMMEKYNVVDASLTTGGGKYPNQDGFGWTNGVYLRMAMMKHRQE